MNVNGVQRSKLSLIESIRSISTLQVYRSAVLILAFDFWRRRGDRALYVTSSRNTGNTTFSLVRTWCFGTTVDSWTSSTACCAYGLILLVFATHRWWPLHGISAILLVRMFQIIHRWVDYCWDDYELRCVYQCLQGSFNVLLMEGQKILAGKSARQMVVGYTAVMHAPSGVSLVRYLIREKTKHLRNEFMVETGVYRFASGFSESTRPQQTKRVETPLAT